MRLVINYLTRRLFFLTILLVLVGGAYTLVGRLLVTQVYQYQADILAMVEKASGLRTEADQVKGSWNWFTPIFTLDNIRLYENANDTAPVIRAKKIQAQFDVLASLLARAPRLTNLRVDGLDLRVECDKDGRYRVPGLKLPSSSSQKAGLLPLILEQSLLLLTNATLTVSITGQAPLIITDLSARLKRLSDFYQFDVSAHLGDQLLHVVIDSLGNPLRNQGSMLKVYAHLSEGDVLQWLPLSLVRLLEAKSQVSLREWRGGGELWGQWQQGRFYRMRGLLNKQNLKIQHPITQQTLDISNLRSQFQLEGNARNSFLLQLADIEFVMGKHVWPRSQLKARFDQRAQSLDLQLDKGLISPLVDFYLFTNPNQPGLPDMLRSLAMKGVFRHLIVHHEKQNNKAFNMSLELAALRLNAWNNIPAARGLSGILQIKPNSGTFIMDAKRVRLAHDKYFRQALDVSRIKGPLHWQIEEDAIRVQSGTWTLNNDDVQGNVVFSVRVPRQPAQSPTTASVSDATVNKTMSPAFEALPELFLMAQFDYINAVRLSRYLPPVIPEKTLAWLDHGLVAGALTGQFLYHGALQWTDHPLGHTLQANVAFKNASVDYQPTRWPAVTHATGSVFIDDGNVAFTASSGKIWSSDISIHTGFVGRNAEWPEPHVQVNGQVKSNMSDALRLLQETPLNDVLNGSAKHWTGRGKLSAELNLAVPLTQEKRKLAVDVKTRFEKSTFSLTPYDLSLGALEGELNYNTQDGLFAEQLKASFFAYPARLTIHRKKAADTALFRMSLDSSISLKTLADWSRVPLLGFTDGVTDYHADFELLNTSPITSNLTIKTAAEGMTLSMPPPFEKSKEQARTTIFTLSSQGNRSFYRLEQDRVFRSQFLVLKDQGLQNLQIVLGSDTRMPPQQAGVTVVGNMPSLDWSAWQPFLNQVAQRYQKQQGANQGAAAGQKFVDSIQLIDLNIDQFDGLGLHLEKLKAQLSRRNQGWFIQANSPVLKGRIQVPDTPQQPMFIALDYFRYVEKPKPDSEIDKQQNSNAYPGVSLVSTPPSQFPPLIVEIDDLQINKWKLGRWKFTGKPDAGRYQINELNIILGDQIVSAYGSWYSSDGQTVTELVGESKGKDVGLLMRLWGQAPTIESKKTLLSFNISWPHSPFDFSAPKVSGKMEVLVKNGRFLDVGAASALRVLGILNFSELGRRLRLDFGDLLKTGHSFDSISGPLYLDKGVLELQRLEVKSPSANMILVGEMDFIQDKLNLDLNLEMQLTKNLVSIAAIMGGPAAGGGMFVIDRLIGDRIEKFASLNYTVKGSPQKPVVKLKVL